MLREAAPSGRGDIGRAAAHLQGARFNPLRYLGYTTRPDANRLYSDQSRIFASPVRIGLGKGRCISFRAEHGDPSPVRLLDTVITTLLAVLCVMFMAACGGSGGDSGTADGVSAASSSSQAPTNQTITNTYNCSHDGVIQDCSGDNCAPTANPTLASADIEESGETDTGVKYLVLKLSTGSVTIIAECGSHVTYAPSETSTDNSDRSAHDNTTTTETP